MLLTVVDRVCVQVPKHISPRTARLLGVYGSRHPRGTQISAVTFILQVHMAVQSACLSADSVDSRTFSACGELLGSVFSLRLGKELCLVEAASVCVICSQLALARMFL